jgi:hypothetical protein
MAAGLTFPERRYRNTAVEEAKSARLQAHEEKMQKVSARAKVRKIPEGCSICNSSGPLYLVYIDASYHLCSTHYNQLLAAFKDIEDARIQLTTPDEPDQGITPEES